MNREQLHSFVTRYLETLQCTILESSPSHLTVRLSPEADKDLTQRPYYWSFVERTGAVPETMTMTFVLDPETLNSPPNKTAGGYLGTVPSLAGRKTIQEEVTLGSRKLEQIFHSVRSRGRFACQFEYRENTGYLKLPYSTWLGINWKVEYICDMKRDEIHSVGICLNNGEIREPFQNWIQNKNLRATLNSGGAIAPWKITPTHALERMEAYIAGKLKGMDDQWAVKAMERMNDELARIESYYGELLSAADEEKKGLIEEQRQKKIEEIRWQHYPRIRIRPINGGLFYLYPPDS